MLGDKPREQLVVFSTQFKKQKEQVVKQVPCDVKPPKGRVTVLRGLPHVLPFQFGNVNQVPDPAEIPCKGLVLMEGARGRLAGQTPRSAQAKPQPLSSYLATSTLSDMVRAPAATGRAQRCHCCSSVSPRTCPSPELSAFARLQNVTAQPNPAEPPATNRARSLLLPQSCGSAGVHASTAGNPGLSLGSQTAQQGSNSLWKILTYPAFFQRPADLLPQESTSTALEQTWKTPEVQRKAPCTFLNTSPDRKQKLSPLNDLKNGGFGNCTDIWFIEHPRDTDFKQEGTVWGFS